MCFQYRKQRRVVPRRVFYLSSLLPTGRSDERFFVFPANHRTTFAGGRNHENQHQSPQDALLCRLLRRRGPVLCSRRRRLRHRQPGQHLLRGPWLDRHHLRHCGHAAFDPHHAGGHDHVQLPWPDELQAAF